MLWLFCFEVLFVTAYQERVCMCGTYVCCF